MMDSCRAHRRGRLLGLLTFMMLAVGLTASAAYAGGSGVTPPGSDVLVTYHVSGGFAGVDERLEVSQDGRFVHRSGEAPAEHGRLTSEDLAALVDVLEASDFATLPPDTVDPDVADAFVYEVTYGGRRVRTSDGSVPARLAPVLDRVREILSGLDSGSLVGRTFVAESVTEDGQPRPPVEGTQIVVTFARDGEIAAEAGCNSMTGPVDVEPDRLVVGQLAMTRMSCGPELDDQDTWLSGLLEGDPAYALRGTRLRLEAARTVIDLVERDATDGDRPLEGSEWQLESIVEGDAVSSLPEGTGATLVFGAGSVRISVVDCNQGSGDVEISPSQIEVGLLRMTARACEPDPSAVEAAVVVVLAGPIAYRIDADVLTLTRPGERGLILRASG